jgi:hypothetical protein
MDEAKSHGVKNEDSCLSQTDGLSHMQLPRSVDDADLPVGDDDDARNESTIIFLGTLFRSFAHNMAKHPARAIISKPPLSSGKRHTIEGL